MTRLMQMPSINVDTVLKLNMAEVQALEALAGYGVDGFLEVFYQHMGTTYLKPHEKGLRSLFNTIQSELPPIIKRYKAARTAFALADPVIKGRAEYQQILESTKNQAVALANNTLAATETGANNHG